MLEVAPLAAELGAEEHARAVGIAEARHQLVALGGREIAGVGERFDRLGLRVPGGGAPELQAQVLDGLARLGEDEHLVVREVVEEQVAQHLQLGVLLAGGQLLRARGERAQALVGRGAERGRERHRRAAQATQQRGEHRALRQRALGGRGGDGGAHVRLELRLGLGQRHLGDLQRALGEAAHERAPVAEQSGRKTIAVGEVVEELLERLVGRARAAGRAPGGARRGHLAEELQLGVAGEERGDLLGGGPISLEQRAHLGGEIARACKPLAQLGLARGRGRIHQAQERVVLGGIELQRRRGEEQEAPGPRGQRLRHLVGALRAQVVGLVEDHQIPAGVGGLRRLFLGAGEPLQGRHHQLVPRPGSACRARRRLVVAIVLCALGVHQREEQVELVEQLREPLHGQVRRRDHQAASDQPRVQQGREHEARFDGLAEAHFIGEHEARRAGGQHLVRHGDLVRLDVDAAREQGAERVGAALEIEADHFAAQAEVGGRAPASESQLLGGTGALRERTQIGFAADRGLLARHLDGVAIELVARRGELAQHLRFAAVGHARGRAGRELEAHQRLVARGEDDRLAVPSGKLGGEPRRILGDVDDVAHAPGLLGAVDDLHSLLVAHARVLAGSGAHGISVVDRVRAVARSRAARRAAAGELRSALLAAVLQLEQLRDALEQLLGLLADELAARAPGGNSEAAAALGAAVRQRGLRLDVALHQLAQPVRMDRAAAVRTDDGAFSDGHVRVACMRLACRLARVAGGVRLHSSTPQRYAQER